MHIPTQRAAQLHAGLELGVLSPLLACTQGTNPSKLNVRIDWKAHKDVNFSAPLVDARGIMRPRTLRG